MSAILSESSAVSKLPLTVLNQNIKVGILGGTNVGKSLLFNLLSRTSTPVEVNNVLFTTVDPAIAIFKPYDSKIAFFKQCHPHAKEVVEASITLMDSAGLIENSFLEAAGLGTGSLKNFAHAEILLVLLNLFQNRETAHYEEVTEPLRELQMIEQELLLMDLNRVESILSEVETILASVPSTENLVFQQETLVAVWEHIAGQTRPVPIPSSRKKNMKGMAANRVKLPEKCTGLPVRLGSWDTQQREVLHMCKLLTAKEIIILANLSSLDYLRKRVPPSMAAIQDFLSARDDPSQLMSLSLELEQRLFEEERQHSLERYQSINITHTSAFPGIIEEIFRTLQLARWYSVSDDKIRAWVIRHGTTAAEAANLVDVFIARNFIRADVMSYEEYYALGGDRLKLAIEGKIRGQGRKYVLNDGDILEFTYHTKEA